METISIKVDARLLSKIDSKINRHCYGTRTEFVREAIRNRIRDLEKEEAINRLDRYYGLSKRTTTNKQLHYAGKKAIKELSRKLNTKLD